MLHMYLKVGYKIEQGQEKLTSAAGAFDRFTMLLQVLEQRSFFEDAVEKEESDAPAERSVLSLVI